MFETLGQEYMEEYYKNSILGQRHVPMAQIHFWDWWERKAEQEPWSLCLLTPAESEKNHFEDAVGLVVWSQENTADVLRIGEIYVRQSSRKKGIALQTLKALYRQFLPAQGIQPIHVINHSFWEHIKQKGEFPVILEESEEI